MDIILHASEEDKNLPLCSIYVHSFLTMYGTLHPLGALFTSSTSGTLNVLYPPTNFFFIPGLVNFLILSAPELWVIPLVCNYTIKELEILTSISTGIFSFFLF